MRGWRTFEQLACALIDAHDRADGGGFGVVKWSNAPWTELKRDTDGPPGSPRPIAQSHLFLRFAFVAAIGPRRQSISSDSRNRR
jgi:hypothetical protein